MTEATGSQRLNVIDLIMEDHREVEQMFSQAQQTTNPDEFQQIVSTAIAELIRHAVAEEQHLYPAFRQYVEGGNELADHEIAEHSEAEETMKEIERLDSSDPQLREKFNTLVEEITHHVQDEEEDALPRLRAACPEGELIRLGEQVESAKRTAPTRPHPAAPDTPPMNKLLAPGAGLVDRVRDAVSGGPA